MLDSLTRLRAALAVAGTVIMLAHSPASADCPASETLCGTGDYQTGEPAASTNDPTFKKMCDFAGLNQEQAEFDLPAGTFKVAVSEGGMMHLWLRDSFTITGPAPGTPITFHMHFQVNGYVNWTGYGPAQQVQVVVRPLDPQGGDSPTNWGFGLAGPYNAQLYADSFDITLARTAGESIGIEIDAQSAISNAGSTGLNGTFSFPDLPAGWTVNSCKGYHKDQPVPATPMTWGHMKAAYR